MKTKLTTLYCKPTGDYAMVENEHVLTHGRIHQIGCYWYEVDDARPGTTARQVCEGFWFSGPTMVGDQGPIISATKVYNTERGFTRALAKYGG